jgi:hypothetical protein
MRSNFLELQEALEAKFEHGPAIEMAIHQGLQTATVFSSFAELYIPLAAGAVVKMTTGADVNSAQATMPNAHMMPDFDWRYKVPAQSIKPMSDPRKRFSPYLPF